MASHLRQGPLQERALEGDHFSKELELASLPHDASWTTTRTYGGAVNVR
jgi:hypothetical protein